MSTDDNELTRESEVVRMAEQWGVSEAEARGMLTLVEASKEELEDARAALGVPEDRTGF